MSFKSIKKIALIFFLGVVAALTVRSVRANPFTSLFNAFRNNSHGALAIQPIAEVAKETVEITKEEAATVIKKVGESIATNASEAIAKTAEAITENQSVLETLKSAAKAQGSAALKFLGKQAVQSVNYLESKSNFQVSGIKVNPITLTKNSCTFINNHREAFATAAVIFGSYCLYNSYRDWYNKCYIGSLKDLRKAIKQDFKNQKAGHEKNAKKRARNHRTWYGFKNATLINRVDHFYDANEKFSSDDFQKIKDICDRKI